MNMCTYFLGLFLSIGSPSVIMYTSMLVMIECVFYTLYLLC